MPKLDEIAEFTNGGNWNQTEYAEDGIPVVRVTDIVDGTVDLSECKFLPLSSLARYFKHTLHTGDLIIATVGSHPTQPGSVVGRAAIVPPSANGALLNQNAVRIAPKDNQIDRNFLAYFGQSADFRKYVIAHARGSANQVRMSIELLKEMPIELPPRHLQERIGEVLANYDALILTNQRRIQILENMLRLIHKEWFIRLRLPGAQGEPFQGRLPEGWGQTELGEVAAEVRKSVDPANIASETPYIGLEHLPRRSIALREFGTAASVKSTKLAFSKGDILFGKIRPYFHKVIVAPIDGICSSDTIVIRPRKAEWFPLILCYTCSDDFVSHATRTSNGTKMPRANWNVLVKYPVVIPPPDVLGKFNETASAMVSQITALATANRKLKATRDLLLPKLLSGDIPMLEPYADTPLAEVLV